MTRASTCLLAAIVASPAAAAEVRIEADTLEADGFDGGGAPNRVVAEGRVRAEAGGWRLRAPRLEYARSTGSVVAEGPFVAQSRTFVLTGRSIALDGATGTARVEGGRLVAKRAVATARLEAALDGADPAGALALGTDALTLELSSVRRLDDGRLVATDAWLTTCDCRDGEALLSMSAARVEVDPGEEVVLHGWAPRLFGRRVVPFDLPVPLTLPLVARRTGVLFPELVLGGPTGVMAGLPVFVTLGESADLTLRTRYAFGNGAAARGDEGQAGSSGPAGELELRWRPAEEAQGSLRVDLRYDRAVLPSGGRRGGRAGVAWSHAQGLGGGQLAGRGEWLSDNAFLADTQVAIERAQLPYLRSGLGYARPLGAWGALAFESQALQDLRAPAQAAPAGFARFGVSRSAAAVAPLARAAATARVGAGRLAGDVSGSMAWESGWPGLAARAGHARRLVAEASAQQRWALLAGPAGALTLEAGERAQRLLAPAAEPRSATRMGLFGGATARLRAGRTFAGGWRHELVPSLGARLLWARGGFAPALGTPTPEDALAPQSELDLAQPEGLAAQGVARLWSALVAPGGSQAALYVEQHLEAAAGRLSGWQAGQLTFGLAWAHARWSLAADGALTAGRVGTAGARLVAPAGAATLSAGGRYVSTSGSDQLGRPLDALFVPSSALAATQPPAPVAQADAQLDWPAAEGVRVQAGATLARAVVDGAQTTQQYLLGASWEGAGCARLSLQVRWTPTTGRPIPAPAVMVGFELGDPARGVAAAVPP